MVSVENLLNLKNFWNITNWNIKACINLGAVSARKATIIMATLPGMNRCTPVGMLENRESLPITENNEEYEMKAHV